MDEQDRFDPENVDDGPVELDEPVEQMTLKDSFGTAMGAAMLGFEQALRTGPPPEVLAAEHIPERDQVTGGDGELVIELPDPIERRSDD